MAQKPLTVFEKMNTPEVKQAFLSRKEGSYSLSEEEVAMLKDYILSDKCDEDIRRLLNGEFFFSIPVSSFLRKKNSQRKRVIYRFKLEEKLLMQYMAFVLHDFDHIYEDSVFSFRLGKHISQIFADIRKEDLSSTHWVLKTDIHSYGDNVQPEILADMLDEIFLENDPLLCSFFRKLLTRGRFFCPSTAEDRDLRRRGAASPSPDSCNATARKPTVLP